MGIDPGLLSLGWAVVDCGQYLSAGGMALIACGTATIDSRLSLRDKLLTLHEMTCKQINIFNPDQGAVEQTLVNVNPRSSLSLCSAKGAVILSMGLAHLSVTEYSPTAIKKAVTGKGNADKLSVAKMLQFMFPNHEFDSSHSADAVAIAVTHLFHVIAMR